MGRDITGAMDKTIALGQDLDAVAFRLSLLEVIKSNLEGWAKVGVHDLAVLGVDSSLTNQLCIVRSGGKATEHDSVIVRIFGENTDQIIDRDGERMMNESLVKIGFDCSAFLGYFGNGRIETFIDGKACSPEDFTDAVNGPAVARSLAPLMGKLHNAVTPVFTEEGGGGFTSEDPINKGLGFLRLAEKVSFPAGHEKASNLEALDMAYLGETFDKTIKEIRAISEELGERSAVHVIAVKHTIIHADLLCGNILVDNCAPLADVKEGGGPLKLWLIDMEYSGVGPPVFDIANHFNEWLGYDVDTALYPSTDARRAFYIDYLDARAGLALASTESEGLDPYRGVAPKEAWSEWMGSGSGDNAEATREQFLRTFDRLVLLHGVLSHLYWAAWAVTLSPNEPATFDYLQYAQQRLGACAELDRVRKAAI